MPTELSDVGEDYFRELISKIGSHPDWILDDEFCSIQCGIGKAAEGTGATIGELRFHHRETSGELYLRLPDLGTPPNAMEALLEQPLDPNLDTIDSDLATRLGKTHQQIASQHTMGYVTAQADPYTVLVVTVPFDYCKIKLRDAVKAASETSKEVEKLHTAIKDAIN